MGRVAAILIDRKRDDRFHSDTPRLLHPCAGRPLWRWAHDAALAAGAKDVLLVGDAGAALTGSLDCVASLDEALIRLGQVSGYLLLYADAPLLMGMDLAALIQEGSDAGSARLPRLLDEDGRSIDDMESAFAYVPAAARAILKGLPGQSLLPKSAKAGVSAVEADYYEATLRVLDRRDLADAEACLRQRILDAHLEAGVTFVDPSTCYVDAEVRLGRDTVVHPFSFLSGDTHIGKG
ncbi:MAG: hypothetical protein ACREKE_04035, partial [bacterium]